MPDTDFTTALQELHEWKQAAQVEAGLRREFLARAEKAEAEIERLRAALMPFAAVGRPFIAACESGALPSGASARYLKLEPLTAEDFANAARAYEQTLKSGGPISGK